jgi:hypothetical protein
MRFYPDSEWRSEALLPQARAAGWVAPRAALPFQRLSSKGISGIQMKTVSAASFRALPSLSPQSPDDCYVVDFGAIIQGGLEVTFLHGQAGRQVSVYAGEVLHADGSVKWWEDFLNDTDYRAVWTLRDGRQTITPHEYKEARYWQLCGAAEAPTHALVRGWRVWYPMGADSDEVGQVVPAVPVEFDPAVFTSVLTSSDQLNSVWTLCRYTLRVAALDVNTGTVGTHTRKPRSKLACTSAVGYACWSR